MKVSVHGKGHEQMGINNQDACLELVSGNKKVKIVCDGCTNVIAEKPETFSLTHNEVGARLFCSKYELLESPFEEEKFEENANRIMKEMLDLVSFSKELYDTSEKMKEYISYHYLFTIYACFETEDKFIVYYLGDGTILFENDMGVMTYLQRKFGKCPPYLAYNYTNPEQAREFTRMEFDKKEIKRVGIATDGIYPAIDEMDYHSKINFDNVLSNIHQLPDFNHSNSVSGFIMANSNLFYDDTTIVF